jgi:hypothetical protein
MERHLLRYVPAPREHLRSLAGCASSAKLLGGLYVIWITFQHGVPALPLAGFELPTVTRGLQLGDQARLLELCNSTERPGAPALRSAWESPDNSLVTSGLQLAGHDHLHKLGAITATFGASMLCTRHQGT